MSLNSDRRILSVLFLLFGIGLVQVYSASFVLALESYGDSLYFFRRQFIFVILGIVALLVSASVPWKFYRRYGVYLWFLSAALIVLTLVPGLGVKVGGAQRWIQLPGFRLEPVELLKVVAPFMFCQFLLWEEHKYLKWVGVLAMFVPIVLLLKQPDFGSFVLISAVFYCLFFTFGKYLKILGATVFATIPAFYFLVLQVPYRKNRVMAFLDPWADPEQKGFQTIQSLLGFHNGGLAGVGLGQGQSKLLFLPAAHTDFTLSVWGEETGFLGFVILLALYSYLVFRGFSLSWRAQESETRAVTLGITLLFSFSIFVNMGVAMGILPPKGLTLPFLSLGGSSLVTLALAFGIILSAERHIREYVSAQKPQWQKFTFRGP